MSGKLKTRKRTKIIRLSDNNYLLIDHKLVAVLVFH